jgi:hypothetical protein
MSTSIFDNRIFVITVVVVCTLSSIILGVLAIYGVYPFPDKDIYTGIMLIMTALCGFSACIGYIVILLLSLFFRCSKPNIKIQPV